MLVTKDSKTTYGKAGEPAPKAGIPGLPREIGNTGFGHETKIRQGQNPSPDAVFDLMPDHSKINWGAGRARRYEADGGPGLRHEDNFEEDAA